MIDDEGNQLGVMPTPRALEMAQERGLDLVEVAPMAAPPVARFLDFGQYKYELTKREKENKRRQRSVTFKEVRLSPKIGTGDFDTKVHRAVEFLEDGDRIKVTVRFRGRELSHPELGRVLLERFSKQVEEHGVVERQPVLEGKSMFIVLASTHKPKIVEPTSKPHRADESDGAEPVVPARRRPNRSRRRPRRQPPEGREPASRRREPAGTKAAEAVANLSRQRRSRWRRMERRRPRPRRRQRETDATMPKMKSHKAAQKRIGVTGSGKVMRVNAWRGHHLEIKSSRRTRRYAGVSMMDKTHAKQVKRLLPYL